MQEIYFAEENNEADLLFGEELWMIRHLIRYYYLPYAYRRDSIGSWKMQINNILCISTRKSINQQRLSSQFTSFLHFDYK